MIATTTDVPAGYKQTEVGVIPEDWQNPQLQEITRDDSPICYGIVQVGPFVPNGVPVLAIKNLNLDYRTNIHRASVEVERPYARSRIQPRDVVVSVKGTTGRVGIIPGHFRGNISRDLARIRPRDDVAPPFVYQMLQSELAQRRMGAAAVGTTRMELSIAILKQVCIPLPPTLAEQEAIADALADADALIESLEQLVAKKRHLKQAAMQQLLTGKKRLPGFEGEWREKAVGQLAELRNGYAFESATYSDTGSFKVVTIANVQDGRMDLAECNAIADLPRELQPYHRLKLGDLLISMTGNVGRVCRVSHRSCVLNQRVGLLEPTGTSADYLFHLLSQRTFLTAMIGKAKGGAQGNLSKGDILEFELYVPVDPTEQSAIAEVLADMDDEIICLEAKLAKARQIKQGMMQELLTGRIRLA